MSATRFVVLRVRSDLMEVAACWPFGSIERTALWVIDAAADQETAAGIAKHLFPGKTVEVIPYAEAEEDVRSHMKKQNRRAVAAAHMRKSHHLRGLLGSRRSS